LALIAGDCEFRNKLGNQGCGAIYLALGRVQKRNPPLGVRLACDRLNIGKLEAMGDGYADLGNFIACMDGRTQ